MDGRRSLTDQRTATRLVLAAITFFVVTFVSLAVLRTFAALLLPVVAAAVGGAGAWVAWRSLRPSRDDDVDRLLRG